jgi:hypothetical protein
MLPHTIFPTSDVDKRLVVRRPLPTDTDRKVDTFKCTACQNTPCEKGLSFTVLHVDGRQKKLCAIR